MTILDNPALGQARTAVHLTDILSRLLPAAALALAGLAAARRRRRALLCFLIPVTALGILGASPCTCSPARPTHRSSPAP